VTTPEPSHTLVSRRRSGWLIGGLLLMAGATAAVAVGWGWKGRRIDAAAPTPMALATTAWEAVDREDGAAARQAIRSLRERGAAGLARVVQARLLVARGFFRPALDLLAALPADKTVADDADLLRFVHLVRGEAAYRLRLYPLAEQELNAVLAAAPDSVDAHRLLAAMTYDAGAIPAAIEHLEATARLAPTDPRPKRLLGLIHNDYERYPEAVEHYQESLRRSPDQADRNEVLLEMAGSLVKLHRHREALDKLDKLAGGNDADLLRAECLLAIGDRGAARGIVNRILETSPDDLGALRLEGSIDLEDGNPQGAVRPLERGVAKHPRDYLVRLKLAQAYAGAGREADADAARAEAERIRALRRTFADLHQEAWARPGDADVRRRLATMAADLDRPDLEQVWLEAAAAVEAGRKPAANRE
jgi:tetratricopeptide (TPR) repeat protein